MKKFVKVAKVPVEFPADLGGMLTSLFDPKDDLASIFNKGNIKQNLAFLAALFPGFTDRYSPNAYYHALETDANRGYNGTSHSQGAYEVMNPALQKAIEDFKKNPPKDLKDLVTDKPISSLENITVPETSDRYKAMREKLYPSSTSTTSPSSSSSSSGTTTTSNTTQKFVKTSQKSTKTELQNLMPKWTIETVLKDMARIQSRKDLSTNEKRQVMANILMKYEKSIAPLSKFLEKNDIHYK